MAIRLRVVNGTKVALCAFETDHIEGDIYLDDSCHYALAAKFRHDWQGQVNDFPYPTEWALMESQKVRSSDLITNKRDTP